MSDGNKETAQSLKKITRLLGEVKRSDYHSLKRRFNALQRENADPKKWGLLKEAIDRSITEKLDRKDSLPDLHFDNNLPINHSYDAIISALENNQVLIVCGETGSGKTTQLPKICLKTGRGINGYIGHTQPRRLAAKTVAKRIADELQSELGEFVGYKIRHQDNTKRDAYIKLMTDGILLAEMQQDRFLNQYDTLIIDEAHERSLNIDFILGYLKQLLPKRPDLKLIITSATIDVDRFSTHFNNAPIVEVSGRSYPVDVLYRPIDEDGESTVDRAVSILDAINELSGFDMGDILVFLEGEGEIHEVDKFLQKQSLPDTDVLPLYARLSSSRQNKIFAPHKRRHIVLATNVAETSLTIPGIRYVIDSGMARISRYSYRSKVQRLPIEQISKAAANQRKGRCGRTSDGICIRLYAEDDFESRTEFTPAEILRTNLSSVILQMKALKLGDINDFPFIDPPDKKFINDGLNVLREINALDKQDKLTTIGKQLARLPLDPRYARIILAANTFNCLNEILIIISALSIQDPRERPIDNTEKADKAHEKFVNEHSDFLWFINLWQFYHKQLKKLSQNKLRKLCQQNFLSYMRMREWQDIHRQLRHVCTEMDLNINSDAASYQNIHCAILTGMPSHVAFLSDKYEYTGARGINLHLFPASSQFNKRPKWIVAADLLETSRLFARNVAWIESQWVINTAQHLLKRHYAEPQWDSKSARVIAQESISLYGMILVANKKVNYGPVNPVESKTLFIRHALLEGDFESSAHFYKDNIKLIDMLRKLEVKSRRPDILDEEEVFDFYMQHMPVDVYDGQSFAVWVKSLDKQQREALFLNEDMIKRHEADAVNTELFPDVLSSQGFQFPLEYKFNPGEADDGLTVDIPLAVLNQLDETQTDYLVPGLLKEKIIVLLKSLPKHIRKTLAPIPDVAEECATHINNYTIPLKNNLAAYLFKTRLIEVKVDDWSDTSLPDYLRVNYRILNKDDTVIGQSKELAVLKQTLSLDSQQAFINASDNILDDREITEWDFGCLPEYKEIKINGNSVKVFPALIEEEGKVYQYAFDSIEVANSHLKIGLRTLFKKALPKEIQYLAKNLHGFNKLALLYSTIGNKQDLKEAIINQVIDETFLYEDELIRNPDRFLAMLEHGKPRLLINGEIICKLIEKIMQLYKQVMSQLTDPNIAIYASAVEDIEDQLEYMVYHCFIDDVSLKYLQQYPRYLEAILKRIDKLSFTYEKDKKNTLLIKTHWNRIKKLVDNAFETGDLSSNADEYRWMIEELRISLFTQELKTRMPVSIKRMDKLWDSYQQRNLKAGC